jgi:hypothetical protein
MKTTKKIKDVEFTFTIEGKDYTSRNQIGLCEHTFILFVPFVNKHFSIKNFNRRALTKQIGFLDHICSVYDGFEILVGNAGEMLIDIEVEDFTKDNINNNTYTDVFLDLDVCRTSLYGEQRLTVGEVKTPFFETLFDYYKSDGSVSFCELYDMRKYNI